jgi:hypothetical protein
MDPYIYNITLDVSLIKFCPGPCNSIELEKEPLDSKYEFKPHTGGRYNNFKYKICKNKYLIIKNARICEGCYKLYQYSEYSLDGDIDPDEISEKSANAILTKFIYNNNKFGKKNNGNKKN